MFNKNCISALSYLAFLFVLANLVSSLSREHEDDGSRKEVLKNDKKHGIKKSVGSARAVIENKDKQKMWNEALALHNKFRAIHGTPALKLNEIMCNEAVQWSTQILQSLQHSAAANRGEVGESLGTKCDTDTTKATVEDILTDWYNQVCKYDFSKENGPQDAGEFTQMIWRETTEFGVGVTEQKNGNINCLYVVARYKKRGNINGVFIDNVPKGSFVKEKYCKKVHFPPAFESVSSNLC